MSHRELPLEASFPALLGGRYRDFLCEALNRCLPDQVRLTQRSSHGDTGSPGQGLLIVLVKGEPGAGLPAICSAAQHLALKSNMHFLSLSGMSAMTPAFPVQPGGPPLVLLICVYVGGGGPLGAGEGTVALERSDLETLGASPDFRDYR